MTPSNFTIMANARRICTRFYQRLPNWALARELFGLGSTSATKLCRDAGIDPDAHDVKRVAA